MIDLTSQDTQKFAQIAIDLLSTNSQQEESKICSSFISLFKNDLSQAKTLTNKLGVDSRTALPVIAAALGNMTILSEFYS